jgi:glucokinase
MLLAGDLGGTTTRLGLFEHRVTRPAPIEERDFTTLDYPNLPAIVKEFLRGTGVTAASIEGACFGVAGPIHEEWADLTNVPWRVGAPELREQVGLARVYLLNDVEALAFSIPGLRSDELAVVHEAESSASANAVLITVGTGFGQAFLHRTGGRPIPMASEGGHADFAARTDREIELLRYLTERFGRADVERVVSGPGLANVADFTHDGSCPHIPAGTDPANVPALVSRAALKGGCERCREALDLMIAALGSAAGNAAITAVARAGVFIGGGVPPKILPALQGPAFRDAYLGKPPMEELLTASPVFVILNDDAGLLGAAMYAEKVS